MFVKVIDMLCMEESALKSHITGEEHLIVQLPVSSTEMFTFLHKKVSSSCDQRPESSANCAKTNIDEFSVPRFRRKQMVNQLYMPSLLRDVKGVGRRQTLFSKITCSLLKLCSGHIEELKERLDRERKGC